MLKQSSGVAAQRPAMKVPAAQQTMPVPQAVSGSAASVQSPTVRFIPFPAKAPCTSADIPVTLGPCVKLQILVPGETANPGYTGGKTGTPLAQTAGVPFARPILVLRTAYPSLVCDASLSIDCRKIGP